MPSQVLGFIASLAVVVAAASIGAIASIDADSFYGQLQKPSWAPPASVFGPVWTTLFALMGVSAWLVSRRPDATRRARRHDRFVLAAESGSGGCSPGALHSVGRIRFRTHMGLFGAPTRWCCSASRQGTLAPAMCCVRTSPPPYSETPVTTTGPVPMPLRQRRLRGRSSRAKWAVRVHPSELRTAHRLTEQ
jgi:hypothetical protein